MRVWVSVSGFQLPRCICLSFVFPICENTSFTPDFRWCSGDWMAESLGSARTLMSGGETQGPSLIPASLPGSPFSACLWGCCYSPSQNVSDIYCGNKYHIYSSYLNQKADSITFPLLAETWAYQVVPCQLTWDTTETCTRQQSWDQARGHLSSWPQVKAGSRVD